MLIKNSNNKIHTAYSGWSPSPVRTVHSTLAAPGVVRGPCFGAMPRIFQDTEVRCHLSFTGTVSRTCPECRSALCLLGPPFVPPSVEEGAQPRDLARVWSEPSPGEGRVSHPGQVVGPYLLQGTELLSLITNACFLSPHFPGFIAFDTIAYGSFLKFPPQLALSWSHHLL